MLDRTELILDIFASRAQTHEARLAVELAQLEYSMPRLKRMWTHLSRQAQGGIGLRGPGEKQLEVDRRLVEKRIDDLQSELEAIDTAARSARWPPGGADDRLAGRLHQRRQEHADERPDRRRRLRRGSVVRHARHADPPLAVAWLGAGAVERHGRFHPRPAAPFDRQLQGHAWRRPGRRTCCCTWPTPPIRPSTSRSPPPTSVLEEVGIQAKDTLLVLNKVDALADPRARWTGCCGAIPTPSRSAPAPAWASRGWPPR